MSQRRAGRELPRAKRRPLPPKSVLDGLWATYWKRRSMEHRNALVVAYHPWLVALTTGLARKCSEDPATLLAVASMGMMEAIGRFEPERKVAFQTYANRRVRGRIQDSLRETDHVPRLLRRKVRAYVAARQEAKAWGVGTPDVQGILGLPDKTFVAYERDVPGFFYHSADAIRDSGRFDPFADRADGENPVEAADRMAWFLRGLSRTERLIVLLYFCQAWSMRLIGVFLEVSESRVSQMLKNIRAFIRNRVEERQCRRHNSDGLPAATTGASRPQRESGGSKSGKSIRRTSRSAASGVGATS